MLFVRYRQLACLGSQSAEPDLFTPHEPAAKDFGIASSHGGVGWIGMVGWGAGLVWLGGGAGWVWLDGGAGFEPYSVR